MTPSDRLSVILDALQEIAAGDLERRVPISDAHDELDALAHAVNVVSGELRYTTRHLSRARDEAERANHSKTKFLRNVSHEIRTPLSAILSTAQLLQAPGLDSVRRDDLLRRIASNARAQLDLIDDLLDLARVESGKFAVQLRPVAVGGVIREALESLEAEAHGRGLALTIESPSDLYAVADPRRVRQILVNLIGNAIKFTDRGRIVVRVTCPEQLVLIDVVDTGIGLSAAQVEGLFEPFAQADASIAARYGGSGLGLALSRRLAQAMGGELFLAGTTLGEGSTFRLSLPAWLGSGKSKASPLDLSGVRVLIVDDHEDVRTPMALLLRLHGAEVMEAADGQEAIEMGAREQVDVVLMDIRMPGIDGLEATRQLRALGVRTPIAALTADGSERQQEFFDAGCTAQFAKQGDVNELIMMIRQLREMPVL